MVQKLLVAVNKHTTGLTRTWQQRKQQEIRRLRPKESTDAADWRIERHAAKGTFLTSPAADLVHIILSGDPEASFAQRGRLVPDPQYASISDDVQVHCTGCPSNIHPASSSK